ncbi:transmembrane protein 199 [Leptopilina heterotoma]|uniref:transmembrane protein 199 n=1 Tax=Leptopilina heterotoma TaxID=63436 RepID=UPI001CA8EFC9|nr:transmembrane protein 199 [Leptopilina heterotoma]
MFVEPIKDHTVKIKPTTRLIEFVAKQVKKKNEVPENIIALKSYGKRQETFLTLKDVKWLNSYLEKYRESSDEKVYLHELLETADVCLPTPPVKPKNPELVARLIKLQAQQNARDYASMTKGVNPYKKIFPEDSIAAQIKEMNKQLIAVAQFVLSVMAGFAFGFIGVELIVGDLDFGFRLLLGIMISLIIALAEIYFLAKKLSEDVYDYPEGTSGKVHQD